VKIKRPLFRTWPLCVALLLAAMPGVAAPVAHLLVRIVTGAVELNGGSVLELRIYETGKPVRRLSLTHGEAWPRDSTRLIPLSLAEPLEPRGVSRFALYYRASSPLSPPLEIVAADVEMALGRAPAEKLLNATLSGVIVHQGELATEERDTASMLCASDSDCDDHRNCNGHERCAPRTAGADARGCVKGAPVSCPVNEVCSETRGCLGPSDIAPR
jgi:hypothetical protein